MPAAAPQKFSFDTHFDDDGRVLSSTPVARPKRAYSPIEVDRLRAEAFAEGQAAQRGVDESLQAQSLAAIAEACRQALPTLDRRGHRLDRPRPVPAGAAGRRAGSPVR